MLGAALGTCAGRVPLAFKAVDERHVLLEVRVKRNGTSFESVCLALGLAMLAHLLPLETVSVGRRRRVLAAALDPAVHAVCLVERGRAALACVIVCIAPRNEMKIENVSHSVGDEGRVHGPCNRNLALGSASLAVEVNANLIRGRSGRKEAKNSKDLGEAVLHVRNGAEVD